MAGTTRSSSRLANKKKEEPVKEDLPVSAGKSKPKAAAKKAVAPKKKAKPVDEPKVAETTTDAKSDGVTVTVEACKQ